jgi:hypothetical protein
MGLSCTVILEHFDQVLGDCFMDCVSCLIAFASNKSHSSSRTSLKSIALLRICEDRLAEVIIPYLIQRLNKPGKEKWGWSDCLLKYHHIEDVEMDFLLLV